MAWPWLRACFLLLTYHTEIPLSTHCLFCQAWAAAPPFISSLMERQHSVKQRTERVVDMWDSQTPVVHCTNAAASMTAKRRTPPSLDFTPVPSILISWCTASQGGLGLIRPSTVSRSREGHLVHPCRERNHSEVSIGTAAKCQNPAGKTGASKKSTLHTRACMQVLGPNIHLCCKS